MKENDTNKRLEEVLTNVDSEEKEELRTMWHLSADADEVPDIAPDEVDELWQQLSNATKPVAVGFDKQHRSPDRGAVQNKRGRRLSPVWMSVLAGLALLITAGILWMQPLQYEAPVGERLAVQLPDGSTVELNSGSRITHPRFFLQNREITLQGEAFFDVQKSEHPFSVSTFNAEVVVLGTSFNIKAWSTGQRPISIVTLQSGVITLSAKQTDGQSVQMQPGQTRFVGRQDEVISAPDLETISYATAWRDGDLVFKNEAFSLVLEEVERRFGVDIALNDAMLAETELTIAFRNPASADEVIESLCHAMGLNYRPALRGYEIFQP